MLLRHLLEIFFAVTAPHTRMDAKKHDRHHSLSKLICRFRDRPCSQKLYFLLAWTLAALLATLPTSMISRAHERRSVRMLLRHLLEIFAVTVIAHARDPSRSRAWAPIGMNVIYRPRYSRTAALCIRIVPLLPLLLCIRRCNDYTHARSQPPSYSLAPF